MLRSICTSVIKDKLPKISSLGMQLEIEHDHKKSIGEDFPFE